MTVNSHPVGKPQIHFQTRLQVGPGGKIAFQAGSKILTSNLQPSLAACQHDNVSFRTNNNKIHGGDHLEARIGNGLEERQQLRRFIRVG